MDYVICNYEADIAANADFSKALSNVGLFKPLSANLIPSSVQALMGVDAMYGFDEDKLNALPDNVLADLHRRGYLERIYAQLKSLQNFPKLVCRFEQQTFSASAKQAGFNA